MLSNAYFLAKFRFDTAENEPAKNLLNFAKIANFANPNKHRKKFTRGVADAAKAAGLDTVCDSVVDSVVHREEVETLRQIQRGLVAGLLAPGGDLGKFYKFCKFLAGSFSAVSKRKFARKYAFDSIFKLYKSLKMLL